ncbi:MAG TPA: hypothetical protein VLM88_05845 [Proteiniclasticum sp.]|nr:hypothetical protein [Proteiniclasticum sp.]
MGFDGMGCPTDTAGGIVDGKKAFKLRSIGKYRCSTGNLSG